MRFETLVKPLDSKIALDILKNDKDSVILGGTTFLRLSDKNYSTAIDLSNLELDYIQEQDNQIKIGAYTSLRTIETDPVINKYFGEILPKAVEHIIGVQFRNNAKIGGAVFGRLGFSEIITALLVLDCKLEFEENGIVPLNEFISNWNIKRDILKAIIIQKKQGKCIYKMLRTSDADFPILSVAVSNFDELKVAIGTRPSIAKLSQKASQIINSHNFKIEEASKIIADEFTFANDMRASGEYRKKIAPVLISRALQEVLS